jgi:hypothetical protein
MGVRFGGMYGRCRGGSCRWLRWRVRCRPPPSVACCCCSLRSRATRPGRGAGGPPLPGGGAVGGACGNDSSGRCPMHLGSLDLLWGRSSDGSCLVCLICRQVSDPKVGRVTPKRTTPTAARPLARPRAPPARAYGAQPRPQLPVVGPRAERAAATSHGRGWAATVAPCKPPAAAANNQLRRPLAPRVRKAAPRRSASPAPWWNLSPDPGHIPLPPRAGTAPGRNVLATLRAFPASCPHADQGSQH